MACSIVWELKGLSMKMSTPIVAAEQIEPIPVRQLIIAYQDIDAALPDNA